MAKVRNDEHHKNHHNHDGHSREKEPVSVPVPTSVVEQPAAAPVTPDVEIATLLASQIQQTQLDPTYTMSMPGSEDKDGDRPHPKDDLLTNHVHRVGNKRLFMTDMLCRVLGCEIYVLAVDKAWVPNPLGKGPNVAIRYTREFPTKNVLFDKFDEQPDEKVIAYKAKLANEHGFKYIYETPEKVLSHQRLNELLDLQKEIKPSDEVK